MSNKTCAARRVVLEGLGGSGRVPYATVTQRSVPCKSSRHLATWSRRYLADGQILRRAEMGVDGVQHRLAGLAAVVGCRWADDLFIEDLGRRGCTACSLGDMAGWRLPVSSSGVRVQATLSLLVDVCWCSGCTADRNGVDVEMASIMLTIPRLVTFRTKE